MHTVMIADQVLVRNGEVQTADEAAVRAEAYEQAEDVAQAGLVRARAKQGETE